MAREQRPRILNVRSAFEGRFRQVAELGSNVDHETKHGGKLPVRRVQPDIGKEQAF